MWYLFYYTENNNNLIGRGSNPGSGVAGRSVMIDQYLVIRISPLIQAAKLSIICGGVSLRTGQLSMGLEKCNYVFTKCQLGLLAEN